MRFAFLLHIGLLMSWGQIDMVRDEIRVYRVRRQVSDIFSDLWHEILHKVGSLLSIKEVLDNEKTNQRLAFAVALVL